MTVLKRLSALLLALAIVLPAAAQFSIGPRVGINVNSLKFDQELLNTDNQTGFTGGIQAELMLPLVNLGVDLSVMYVHRGSTEVGTEKINNDYIEIPLNLKYKFGLPVVGKIVSPYIFTGPSFAFRTSKEAIENAINNKTTDIAWNFGFGIQLFKKLQIGASYGLGLTKAVELVSDHQGAGIEGKNNYWTVTAAWLF